jgi:hypothetical protein
MTFPLIGSLERIGSVGEGGSDAALFDALMAPT